MEPASWNYVISLPFVITAIATFVLSYTIPPILARTFFQKELTFEKRRSVFTHVFVGAIQSIIAIVLCAYLYTTGDIGSNVMYSRSSVAIFLVQLSFGFYVADFIVHCRDNTLRHNAVQTLIHHGFASLASVLVLYYQGVFMHFAILRLVPHITCPFLYVQYIMANFNMKKSPWYTVISISMTVISVLFRVVPIIWTWRMIFYATIASFSSCSHMVPWPFVVLTFIGSLLFDIGNVVFVRRMVKGCIKHVRSVSKKVA